VGSGTDANTWHYFANRHKINPATSSSSTSRRPAPDDHGHHRTFPIDGKFTPEQAKWYQADLESQKAVIDLLKPGNTYEQAAAAGKAVYDKYNVPKMKGADGVERDPYPMRDGKPGISGHWVGMATHDAVSGPLTGPIKAGQVVTVEPIIEIPDKHWHFRVEDTILITEHGPEVLSSDVPKELVDVEKLVGARSRSFFYIPSEQPRGRRGALPVRHVVGRDLSLASRCKKRTLLRAPTNFSTSTNSFGTSDDSTSGPCS